MKSVLMLCAFVFAAAVSLPAAVHSMASHPLVKVPEDVDVYDQPGGVGKPRKGFLAKDSIVALLDGPNDDWCHVSGDAVPGKEGWVWCGVQEDGTSYELTKVDSGSDTGTDTSGSDTSGSGTTPMEPVEHDCKDIGPNEQMGGGSSDPNETFKCTPLENGGQHCCWYTSKPQ
jgi:hypothetical protein